ncbi:endonuclease/exonuclease/phosphatase family protein [Aestuariivirga sp.]|uniref:endonuclease/exonuclease/phosphatase family protein n=1 Tax=Aestuariivirga sp. TaxID=2650926 RepID=UPI003016387D
MRQPLLALLILIAGVTTAQATDLTIMSFNIYGGGANDKKPVDETAAVIKAVGADIIGVQETRLEGDPCTAEVCPAAGESVAAKLAAALGYYYYDQTRENAALWANAIISRYPIGKATPNDTGVEIDVNGRKVHAYNIHLDDAPYQPYQLLGIEYGPYPFLKTADEAVKAAAGTRGPGLKLLFDDMDAAGPADADVVFGDFNEPSHRDWTESAVRAGLQPLVVPFPTVKAIEDKGFVDTFRAIYPDAGAKPGMTWTPTTEATAKDDHHDRIDFALARGKELMVISAGIVGEKAPEADIVVTPWPSDHRATMATVKF